MRQAWPSRAAIGDRVEQYSFVVVERAPRIVALVATGVLGLFALAVLEAIITGAHGRGDLGWDLGLYTRNAERWLGEGELYRAWQLAGPYPAAGEVNLYPPLAMYLFVPFIWLPHLLWWVIPGVIVGVVFWTHRPPIWTWPIFAAIVATAPFGAIIAYGNSGMWVVAIVSAATLRPATAVLLAFKPSVFPIALLFAYRRSWWLGLGLVAVMAIPLGLVAWQEFIVISRNLEGTTVLYSLHTVPLVAAPILAWLAGRRSPLRGVPQQVRVRARRPFSVPPVTADAATELSKAVTPQTS